MYSVWILSDELVSWLIDTELETGLMTGMEPLEYPTTAISDANPAIGAESVNAEPEKLNVPFVESEAAIIPEPRLPVLPAE